MLTKIFQKREEYDIMGYTQKQHEWCKKNESNLWNFIVDKKELFQTNNMRINSYLNDGPFTSEISQECPARIGTWIGLQIVKKYMNKNDISMVELINNWDAENILYNSKYRP